MKMADGGFRPAYNVQVTSAAGEQIVVAVAVCNTGSDRGLMRPMLERVRARTGHFPARHLADGGFNSAQDIEWAHGEDIAVYCPPTQSKHGTDPYLPRRGDGEGVLAWRARMASEAGKVQYKSPLDLRMHPCTLAQLEPAPIDCARHRKSPRRRALLRA